MWPHISCSLTSTFSINLLLPRHPPTFLDGIYSPSTPILTTKASARPVCKLVLLFGSSETTFTDYLVGSKLEPEPFTESGVWDDGKHFSICNTRFTEDFKLLSSFSPPFTSFVLVSSIWASSLCWFLHALLCPMIGWFSFQAWNLSIWHYQPLYKCGKDSRGGTTACGSALSNK